MKLAGRVPPEDPPRREMAWRRASTGTARPRHRGKVKVVYDGQGQPSSVEVTDAALGEGADKVAQGVVDAAKQAQGEALVKMKAVMRDMQKDIAKLQADMKSSSLRNRIGTEAGGAHS